MNVNDLPEGAVPVLQQVAPNGVDLLPPVADSRVLPLDARESSSSLAGAVIGEVLALVDDGTTALVCFPGQEGMAALPARSCVDLHGTHIGKSAVLVFENADPKRPVILALLHDGAAWPMDDKPAQVDVDVDGRRLIVSAKEQLVLRCGKASITLTRAGKVLIEGSYVLSRSTGANRIKGGSVQLN